MNPRLAVLAGPLVVFPILLSGCGAGSFGEIDRAKYGRVAIDRHVKKPKSYSYTDKSMRTTAAVSASFGLAGALVGSAAIAAQEKSGKDRVGGAIERSGVDPGSVLVSAFERDVRALNTFEIVPGSPDATFRFEIVRWGFDSGGSGRLGATLAVRTALVDREGREVWDESAWATSETSWTHDEYNANPKLYQDVFREAAEAVVRKITSGDDGED